MAARNGGSQGESQMAFRVGVHLGDIIVEGDDLYGDGVNIASRLEGIAERGGICISRRAATELSYLGRQRRAAPLIALLDARARVTTLVRT